MRKLIAMLLAAMMLLSCIGTLPVFAADEIVHFKEDFETHSAGDKPYGMYLLESAEKQYLCRAAETDGNMALFVHHAAGCECGQASGPFARVAVDFTKYKDLSIRFKVKSVSAKPTLTAHDVNAGVQIMLFDTKVEKWTEVEVFFDLVASTYSVKVDGKETKKPESLAPLGFGMPEAGQFRFGANISQAGGGAYYDDIVISSSALRDTPYEPPKVETPKDVFVPTTKPADIKIPSNMYEVWNLNFSNSTTGLASAIKIKTDDGNVNPFSTTTNYIEVVDVEDNRLLRFGGLDGKVHGPVLRIALPESAKKYTAEFAVAMQSDANLFMRLMQYKKEVCPDILKIAPSTEGAKDGWHYVRIDIDLEKGTVSSTLNGNPGTEHTFVLDGPSNIELSFTTSTSNNGLFYIDNIMLYSQDKPQISTMFVGKKIYWENVVPSKPISEDSYVKNLVSHPRVFVTDWEAMREKINLDYYTRKWYASIKRQADDNLVTPMTEWKLNSRNNVLESARAAKMRLIELSFVYGITGDEKYAKRAYEEALYYGSWPDWSGMNSTFVTAQIMEGYGCLYDWLYDYLTAEQKKEIVKIMKTHGFPDFLYHYQNMDSWTGHDGGNWNPVCNEAAIAAALAVADEEPELAEYILEIAPANVWNAMWEYSPEGSYEETVSYWNAGTMNVSFIAWFMDTAFKEDFKLPESHDLSASPNLALTAEFPIYGHGSTGMFNYGDCVPGFQVSPAMYWAAMTYDKPQYAWWANKTQTEHGAGLEGQYLVATLAFYDPNNAYYVPGAFPLDKHYTVDGYHNAAWLRSSWVDKTSLYAAMQGGPYGGHQHLSLGTYVIDYMGKRFIRQINYYDYALNFDDLTIAYYRRGEGYNTLIANPTRGEDILKKGVAKQIAYGTSDNTAFGVFDMTTTNKDYADAKRGIMMTDNRRRVIIQDEVKAKTPSEFYWFANSDASIKIAKDGKSALLTIGDANMLVRIIKAPEEAKFEIVERKSLFENVNNVITGDEGYKLQLHFENKTELELCVEYVALKEGEGLPLPWQYTKMENWTTEETPAIATAVAGSNVVLKIGTPNAIANGVKTMVDTNNADVVPFTENGRTLVPVRFIAEAFGAKVGWDDKTQSVTVEYLDKDISLVIGSNEMKVNGETVLLDVPANTYNSRTLIPLRALVEALGMKVFWDDRGLISIGLADGAYTEAQIVTLLNELDIRVTLNGKDVKFFDAARTAYTVDLNSGDAVPTIAAYVNGVAVPVTQATAIGESASFTIADKTYTILMQKNAFEGVIGNRDPGVITEFDVLSEGVGGPDHDTFIYVEDLKDSTNWEKYPKRGIVDGVINDEIKNRWASDEEGAWIQMDFGSVKNVYSMAFAGLQQYQRAYKFDVLVSEDGDIWNTVHTGGMPTSEDYMQILPLNVQARYVKLVGYGYGASAWNTYCEVRFYESAAQEAEDKSWWEFFYGDKSVKGSVGTQKRIVFNASDDYRSPVEVRADAIVTYEVADTSIATVSPDGIVSFIAPGKTTVRVTITQDGHTVVGTGEIAVE